MQVLQTWTYGPDFYHTTKMQQVYDLHYYVPPDFKTPRKRACFLMSFSGLCPCGVALLTSPRSMVSAPRRRGQLEEG